jgi:hypothetical protein
MHPPTEHYQANYTMEPPANSVMPEGGYAQAQQRQAVAQDLSSLGQPQGAEISMSSRYQLQQPKAPTQIGHNVYTYFQNHKRRQE